MKNLLLTLSLSIITLISCVAQPQLTEKEQSVQDFRKHFSQNNYRGHSKRSDKTRQECIDLLDKDGIFSDLRVEQEAIIKADIAYTTKGSNHERISKLGTEAFNRLWLIADEMRGDKSESQTNLKEKIYKGIINYGNIETERANVSTGRFHMSCFAIPTAAVNTYFCFSNDMDAVESGKIKNELYIEANKIVKKVGMQSWTQPFRNDFTDDNVIDVERFRNHVWWVGGNGIAYRSVFSASIMMSSVEMVDVLAEVSKKAMSWVSQNTYETAFWTEGFTADGAGWGHGMQCLIWGYPVHGTSAALALMKTLQGTPWSDNLERYNCDALLNFVRGSSWHYYKGYIPPCLGRGSMAFNNTISKNIPDLGLVKSIKSDWSKSFTPDEQKEISQFIENSNNRQFLMKGMPDGKYTGTRWFFNNDNLIKKEKDHYVFVNMASVRCDGIESANTMADAYNIYTCDGMTLFMRDGNEYAHAQGAWNLTAIPGVTSRQGEDMLSPIMNWRGFCSKHNFAAAATRGGKNAVAGYIFEKLNASEKKNTNDKSGITNKNSVAYGVKAFKSYFFIEDHMLAMGAGITNLNTKHKGDIWTTIDQTLHQGEVTYPLKKGIKVVHKGVDVDKTFNIGSKDLIFANEKGFVYTVLAKHTTGKVLLKAEKRDTKWAKISGNNRKEGLKLTETEDIYQLSINHGKKVKNGTYAYVVSLNEKNSASSNPFTVLSNTTKLQAVCNNDKSIIQAVFYDINSTLKIDDITLSVDAQCALMIEETNDSYICTVTDANMNKDLKEINITVNFDSANSHTVTVKMEQGAMCGKPASTTVSKR